LSGRVTQFVVLSSQRSGSTLLVKSLDSAPEIFCAGEIFHPGERTLHREFQFPYLRTKGRLIPRIAARFLQSGRVERHLEYFFGSAGAGVRAAGFKLMVSQAEKFGATIRWLKRHRVRVICLYRRNTFDAAMSYYLAAHTGRFHSDRPAGVSRTAELTVNVADFREFFHYCEKDRARILELQSSFGGMLVAYEDLVGQWSAWIGRIGAYLGVEGLNVPMSLEKLGDEPEVRIVNESELRRHFPDSGTPA
jgi:LPS sulfotransferase NodH